MSKALSFAFLFVATGLLVFQLFVGNYIIMDLSAAILIIFAILRIEKFQKEATIAREKAIEAKDLNAHIGEVGLSTRAFTCLSRAGYKTVGDLEGNTATDLIKIRNMGRKSVEEIISLMRRFGMEVKIE